MNLFHHALSGFLLKQSARNVKLNRNMRDVAQIARSSKPQPVRWPLEHCMHMSKPLQTRCCKASSDQPYRAQTHTHTHTHATCTYFSSCQLVLSDPQPASQHSVAVHSDQLLWIHDSPLKSPKAVSGSTFAGRCHAAGPFAWRMTRWPKSAFHLIEAANNCGVMTILYL